MSDDQHNSTQGSHKIDRLLDAIDLVKSDQRSEALPILKQLIREDSNFADAWLWMSVAVDEMDQSIICLDNVLRINPDNLEASTALYHLRQAEVAAERKRAQLRRYRDIAAISLWVLILTTLFASVVTILAQTPIPA